MSDFTALLINGKEKVQFGLGTSQIASLGRRLSYNEAKKLFNAAFSHGIDIVDTADAYGSGDSERLIGRAIKDTGKSPFVITKAGFPYSSAPSWISPLNQVLKKAKEKIGIKKNFSPSYILNSINKSLKRLDIDKTGALLLHELTEEDIAKFDCWNTLQQVKESGLTELTGISSNVPSVIKKGIESGFVNIVETKVQYGNKQSSEIVSLCRSSNIPVIANEILGPFHSGAYDTEKIISEVKLIKGLESIKHFQLLIGVTYSVNKVNCILLGTRNEKHLTENIAAQNYFPVIEQNLEYIEKIYSDNRKA